MSNTPAELKYTPSHEWVKIDGGVATIGITDYAQAALGDLVFVDLPAKGRQVKAGEAFVVVESVKAASEVYAPLAGEVVEVNEALAKSPEAINASPYGGGWICKLRVQNQADAAGLLDAAKYQGLTG